MLSYLRAIPLDCMIYVTRNAGLMALLPAPYLKQHAACTSKLV
jgi:hypothetical protein